MQYSRNVVATSVNHHHHFNTKPFRTLTPINTIMIHLHFAKSVSVAKSISFKHLKKKLKGDLKAKTHFKL